MNVRCGDIILVRGDTPIISRAIRWFTGSKYTHAGIAVTSNIIYEIDVFKKLDVRLLTHHDYDVYRLKEDLTIEQQIELKLYAINKIKESKGYDWFRIIQFALEKIGIKLHLNNKKRYVCSEIIDELYNHVGIDLIPNRTDGEVTPADISGSPLLKKVAVIKDISS